MTVERSRSTVDIDIDVETGDTVPPVRVANDDSLATVLLVSRLSPMGVRPLKASEFWRLVERLGGGRPSELGHSGVADFASGHRATLGVRLSELAPSGVAEAAGGHQETPAVGLSVILGQSGVAEVAGGRQEIPAGGLSVVLGQSEDELVRDQGLAESLAERVAGLLHRATALAFELDRLEQSGIKTVTAFDEHYPRQWLARLGAKAPPLLHGAGTLDLLNTPGLGVVGSRDVSAEGGETAKEIARLAARRGLPLVSGGARGVDQLAMDAAFEAGGAVVGILAESLTRKLKQPDVRRAVYDADIAMCTPYRPDAPFTAGNAMGRNKLIYAQAALTVVVASDDGTGGTWSGATEALKHGFGPVAVWRGPGEGPGNEPLQQRGAIPVSSLEDVETLLDTPPPFKPEPPPTPPNQSGQQSLFATTSPA